VLYRDYLEELNRGKKNISKRRENWDLPMLEFDEKMSKEVKYKPQP
jgi:hypothetical protein